MKCSCVCENLEPNLNLLAEGKILLIRGKLLKVSEGDIKKHLFSEDCYL